MVNLKVLTIEHILFQHLYKCETNNFGRTGHRWTWRFLVSGSPHDLQVERRLMVFHMIVILGMNVNARLHNIIEQSISISDDSLEMIRQDLEFPNLLPITCCHT